MEVFESIYFVPLLTGPIIVLAGWFLMTYPPKSINSLYGYRTKSSMRTQERWDFAQTYSGFWMMVWGAIMGTGSGIAYLLWPDLFAGQFWVGLIIMVVFIVIPIVQTEKKLSRFD